MENFGFRRDQNSSQVMLTAVNGNIVTQIRFGSPSTGDLPPPGESTLDQKLDNLTRWLGMNDSSLTGPAWLDVRIPDQIIYPSDYNVARRGEQP